MSRETIYLVIRSDHSVRAVKRLRMANDEIAIPIHLDFPAAWGTVLRDAAIDITVPDFTPFGEGLDNPATAIVNYLDGEDEA